MINPVIVQLALVLQTLAPWAAVHSDGGNHEPGIEAVGLDESIDGPEVNGEQDQAADSASEIEGTEGQEPTAENSSGSWIDDNSRLEALFGNGHGETWSMHKLNYAVIGADDAKVQTSFKYRLTRESNWYLSYSVVVGWDIYEPSIPYRDINFMPEVFWRWEPAGDGNPYSVDVGYWHNSNGKDKKESRAWDRAYVRTVLEGKLLGRNAILVPSAYATIAEGGRNEDISEYLGNWDLRFLWHSMIDPKGDDLDLGFVVMAGRDNSPFDRGSVEVTLSYKIPKARFNPRLFLQYFSGYGDTLIEYDVRKTTLRFGLAL